MLQKLRNLLRLGVVSSSGDDRKTLPSQLVDYHGKEGDAVPWYPYGLHGVAEEGSYVLIIGLNGNSEERICIPTSMLKRPMGDPGEVFLFHPPTGTQIKLDASGNVVVTAVGEVQVNSPTLVKITAPDVEIVGNLDVSGDVGIGGDTQMTGDLEVIGATTLGTTVTSNAKDISDSHQHNTTSGLGDGKTSTVL